LEVDRDGNEVFPQLDLPGSAQEVDLTNVSQASVSASLTRAGEVQWYQVVQKTNSLQSVEASVQTEDGLEVQVFRYGFDKRAGRNPDRAAGTCAPGLPVVNRFMSRSGNEYFRVQGCPGKFVGDYSITFTKVGLFYALLPFELGRATGQVLDAETGMPVNRAWLSADGGSSFTSTDGEFDVGLTPGTINLSVFHPDYSSAALPPISIAEGETVVLPSIELLPTTYRASPNQTVFVNGFE
ncbi:MAG: hypothetical protein AB8B96_21950, partial [Lysobacterales bacterium]